MALDTGKPRRTGQVFVMSAIIFSSIVLLAVISTQQATTTNNNADFQTYFQSILERQPEIVDAGLKNNYSIASAKREAYSFNRFVERRSTSKSLSYNALQLIMLPEKQEAVFINYRREMTSFNLYGDSWTNETLNPYQSAAFAIQGEGEYRLIIEEANVDRKFNASKPSIFSQIHIEEGETVLTDSILR